MNSGKTDNQLNLALDVSEQTREKTADLSVGFDPVDNRWELIVKYSGSLSSIMEELYITAVELINEYAVITIEEELIDRLLAYPEIEYVEKPRQLFFAAENGRAASCVNSMQTENTGLFGKGVIVAVIDSGIDYSHPDFRNADGSSRILAIWDQTIPGNPPEGYAIGSLYTKEKIDDALKSTNPAERLRIVPSVDLTGHGTHVCGIACGNGRASNGRYRGVARQSDILAVKLGTSIRSSFPRTTQLMEAIDFCVKEGIRRNQPIVINISFGNNYGARNGRTILENYINDIANLWKSNIVIGSGNEGDSANHQSGIMKINQTEVIEFAVGDMEPNLNLQFWKNYNDVCDVEIVAPSGAASGRIPSVLGTQRFSLGSTELLLYYGDPIPFNRVQEIYFEFIPKNNAIESGIWKINIYPSRVVTGNFDMWLPVSEGIGRNTRFLRPTADRTLTIPSTAFRAITVGAYNSFLDSYASFSGRGYTRNNADVKPDLAAPGVDITSASPGGGYSVRTGTSMATPFVTGAAALMMEWGIVKGNDSYLYGEKLKAFLIKGARHLPGISEWPNRQLGWGVLCLRDSLPG